MDHFSFRKFCTCAALLFTCFFLLTGCSGGKKGGDVTIDPAALAKELAEGSVTSEALTEMASSMIAGSYYISDDIYAGGSAWKGTGATACEVVVIEAKEAGKTGDVESKLKEHVASQSDLYASYAPEEVEKLDKAVLKSTGKYTVLCVCDDTAKAEEILKKAGF